MLILTEKTSSHRLGALVDGVFAIVMTILVLDIKAPQDLNLFKQFGVQPFLTGHFQDIVVYMVVFIILAYLWILHHGESHFIKFTNYIHLWLTAFYLMFIALVPFSSSLVNKAATHESAELFLAWNMFMIGIFNYLSWAYVAKNRSLLEPGLTDVQITREKKKLIVMPLVSIAAMLTVFICPLASSYVLLLAPVVMYFLELRWSVRSRGL